MTRRAQELSGELKQNLQRRDSLLDHAIIRNEDDVAELKKRMFDVDVLLLYLVGAMPLTDLMRWGLPVIVFSGQYTPTLALYALGVERHSHLDIHVALDFRDIDEEIRQLDTRKRLQNTRIALFGFPPPLFSRWHHLPDLEAAGEKLGVQFSPVELRELAALLPTIDIGEAQAVAEEYPQ